MSWFKRLSGSHSRQEHDRANTPSPNPYSNDSSSLHPSNPFSGPSSGSRPSSSHTPQHSTTDNNHHQGYPADKKKPFTDDEPSHDEPPPAYSSVPPGFSAPSAAPASSYPSMMPSAGSSIHHFFSPTNNASHDSFTAGNRFCALHPLAPPLVSAGPESLTRIFEGNITMAPESPHRYITITTTAATATPGSPPPTSIIRITKRKCPDSTILSQVPLYLARYHHPSVSNPVVVIGYHLAITGLPLDGDSVIAMGFACVPYPQYRLPGWHRGSLGIHSDDGRRYCNDGYGGVGFTRPFMQGENLTLALVYRWVDGVGGGRGRVETEIVFIRNGRRDGGWRVRDDLQVSGRGDPKIGFVGERDIFAAVGVAGGKGVECVIKAMSRNEAWMVVLGEQPPPPSYEF